jgi:hypothetical protein
VTEQDIPAFLTRHPRLRPPHRAVDDDGDVWYEWWTGGWQGSPNMRKFSIIFCQPPSESEWIYTYRTGQECGALDDGNLDAVVERFIDGKAA